MIRFDCRLRRRGFDYDVAFESQGGVTALFGPSGCGKTTTIRLLAGLDQPQRGQIALGEEMLLDTALRRCLPAHRRRFGLVFQDAQLFPHLTVRGNLHYGRWFAPRGARPPAPEPIIEVLGIGDLLDRMPHTLSGGERQRVAIGRALMSAPRLLMMDEPLASLDAHRKLEVLPFIEQVTAEFAMPVMYVSHSLEEVARLADRVIRLDKGRVVAAGTPAEVLGPTMLARSGERFDAVSLLTGEFKAHLPEFGVTLISHPAGEIVIPGRLEPTGAPARVAIRATNVTLAVGRPGNISIRTGLESTITGIDTDGGPFALVTLRLKGGDTLHAYVTRLALEALGLDEGDEVLALIKAVAIDERGVTGLRLVPGERRAPP